MTLSRTFVSLTLTSLFTACSSGSDGNSAAAIANLQVPSSKLSPVQIRFELRDREGETVAVELTARVPLPGGGLSDPQVLAHVSGPGFPANGSSITIPPGNQVLAIEADWRFPEEDFLPDDGRFVEGIQLLARLSTGAELVLGDDEPLSIGNDAPQVTAVTPIIDPGAGEVAGITRIEVTLEDSSDDVVTVAPEFDIQGDVPDASWQPALGFGLSDVRVSRDGTTQSFFWDTNSDLTALDRGGEAAVHRDGRRGHGDAVRLRALPRRQQRRADRAARLGAADPEPGRAPRHPDPVPRDRRGGGSRRGDLPVAPRGRGVPEPRPRRRREGRERGGGRDPGGSGAAPGA